MSSITNDQLLEHNFVSDMPNDNEQDILDEFLDQRVYESINLPDSNSIKVETDDLLNDFYNNNDSNDSNNDGSNYGGGSGNTNYLLNQSQMTTPNNDYMYLDNIGYNGANSSYTSPNDSSQMNIANKLQLSDYDIVRDELSKLKFGTANMKLCPKSVDVPDPSYLDFSQQAMDSLPYKLTLTNLPSYSRVETQIKFKFGLSPPPPHVLLHIPQDLISKNKFCLSNDVDTLAPTLKESLLYLDTFVLTSDYKKSCNICSRCIKREQKRASRRKSGINGNESDGNNDTNNDNSNTKENGKSCSSSWADDKMMKKAIIFNCKEIVSFPPPNGLNNDLSKSMDLSARIICYCRHHKESQGFKLLFVVKNHEGKVVAKQISSTIMIMDRKKTTAASKNKVNEDSLPNSICGSSTNLQQMAGDQLQQRQQRLPRESDNDVLLNSFRQLSSNSIDESNSEAQTNTDTNTFSDGRNLKRKKLSVDDSFNTQTNPMFNGSVNALSPLSNSDTNTSTSNMLTKPNQMPSLGQPSFGLSPLSHPQLNTQQPRLPSIQRIIPAQGPIRGGIEITLLGFNFRQGLAVKFGANQALATHCWSETTLVTYLPPASQPGQVLVSFEDHENTMIGGPPQQQIFTYTDDTDKQLIELALQIVGLKMNGKLEDAKNIAKRIVGTDNSNISGANSNTTSPVNHQNMNQANIEWFDSAHKTVLQLTKSDLSTEEILINFLSLVDLPNCPIIIPNWQLCNGQGQTLLHLASLKKYSQLIKFLITHGCKIDVKDNQGLTPLFLASMCGHRDLIQVFVACKSNWNLKLSNDKLLKDYCDPNVLDVFNSLEDHDNENSDDDFSKFLSKDSKLAKSMSLDSLNSMFAMNFGCHVSKMVMENTVNHSSDPKLESGDRYLMREELNSRSSENNSNGEFSQPESDLANSEFADSEFESNDDDRFYNDDYDESESEDDYEDEMDANSDICDNRELNIGNVGDVLDDTQSLTSNSTILPPLSNNNDDDDEETLSLNSAGLWQKVKNVFSNDESDSQLPSYDDLFPFGPSSFHLKPKSSAERSLNTVDVNTNAGDSSKVLTGSSRDDNQEDAGVSSDSSDDMVISYINHPRKTVENDKMLLFFWFPALVCIMALFIFVYIMGYKFEFIENFKHYIRTTIGNLMVGNERIGKLFHSSNTRGVESVLLATRRMINE
ncbi:uncharacterized protein AC631_03924 [Debaryomyces fabryi]|uniref:IPT/TIG domain-containing protein n=1 Tax=Debaryomyces fabryi TaxID=58627 RepID=A0A0V1PVT4_9ASCO|nr:uncharacterized protein AC631_03924 [Debaryomyces fabryi]KSA00310.1 hypothetical protein AC631_03924 [Debaryomyces fabryi]CUM56256.1 unnamed protein product [Debaryomyces fabryi]